MMRTILDLESYLAIGRRQNLRDRRELQRELGLVNLPPRGWPFTLGQSQPKLKKSDGQADDDMPGTYSIGLTLAPFTTAGLPDKENLCPDASPGCMAACLFTAGKGGMRSTRSRRVAKTRGLLAPGFAARLRLGRVLSYAVTWHALEAYKRGLQLAVRMNVNQDVNWIETLGAGFFRYFSGLRLSLLSPAYAFRGYLVQFYDYTKSASLYTQALHRFDAGSEFPWNYDLTFSRSEINDKSCQVFANRGGRIAVVVERSLREILLAQGYWGKWRVYDGVKTDLRFREGPGVVLLEPLGRAKRDSTGFVVRA